MRTRFGVEDRLAEPWQSPCTKCDGSGTSHESSYRRPEFAGICDRCGGHGLIGKEPEPAIRNRCAFNERGLAHEPGKAIRVGAQAWPTLPALPIHSMVPSLPPLFGALSDGEHALYVCKHCGSVYVEEVRR
jgi:hypothetical protein